MGHRNKFATLVLAAMQKRCPIRRILFRCCVADLFRMTHTKRRAHKVALVTTSQQASGATGEMLAAVITSTVRFAVSVEVCRSFRKHRDHLLVLVGQSIDDACAGLERPQRLSV